MNTELNQLSRALEEDINSKLDKIRENLMSGLSQDILLRVETLSMISDELSDVLLNFEDRPIQSEFGDI